MCTWLKRIFDSAGGLVCTSLYCLYRFIYDCLLHWSYQFEKTRHWISASLWNLPINMTKHIQLPFISKNMQLLICTLRHIPFHWNTSLERVTVTKQTPDLLKIRLFLTFQTTWGCARRVSLTDGAIASVRMRVCVCFEFDASRVLGMFGCHIELWCFYNCFCWNRMLH